MQIRRNVAAIVFAAALSAPVLAGAQGTFLCMRNEETIAITNDEYNNLKYIELRDSKGALVAPQISSDGNTYLPFRYICDITGISDGNAVEGDLPDNSYRFIKANPYIPYDMDKIEIMLNGSYYCHNIGENFEYTSADGSVRNVAIYNIRGTLYAPMAYLASLTGAYAAWNESLSQIMFVENGALPEDFLSEYNSIRRDRQMWLGYELFGNNLTNSPLYLKTDGMTVANLSDELPGSPAVRCVSRSGPNIFYIDADDRLNVASEYSLESFPVIFIDEYGTPIDVHCSTAFVLKNKIYGIKTDSVGETDGILFSCDLDGRNLRYLTGSKVYNLIMKSDMLDYYLFYCDSQTRSTLHMIREKTMDDYELQITNFAHENMLSDIKQFAVGNERLYYIDIYGSLHVIELEFPLEQISITRLKYGNTLYTVGSDGGALNNITSMNYDYFNDLLYLMQTDDIGRIYCLTPWGDQPQRIGAVPNTAGGLAIFHDSAYFEYITGTLPDGLFKVRANYDGETVTLEG